MWRAFFFAIGATLIFLGGQGLVVDHFEIANGTRVPRFIAKYLKVRGPNGGPRNGAPLGNVISDKAQQVATNAQRFSTQANASLPRQNGSRFGPSRFADSQFSNTNLPADINYYGGVPFSNRQSSNAQGQFSAKTANPNTANPNSQFSLAGYDGQQGFGRSASAQAGGVQVGHNNGLSPVTLGGGGSQLVKPAEWMPWGLLAVGTLVVLYTKSIGRGYSTE